jgi:hypothetical protein
MIVAAGCTESSPRTCGNIEGDACSKIILPMLRSTFKGGLDKYDTNAMWFTQFDCDWISPLKPKAGEDVPEIHVHYDSCKRTAWVSKEAVL